MKIKIDDLKNNLDLGEYGERLNDYRNSSAYVCDAIMEIADNDTSIYYHQILEFISNNPDSLAEVIAEGLYDPSRNYDLYAHGQAAEFMTIERDIYNHLADALYLAALDFIKYDAGFSEIPDDLAELVRDWADNADNDDRMSDIPDKIKEWLKENGWDE